jgi:TRAP-type C4-dicarboxylate transport system permease small subunit
MSADAAPNRRSRSSFLREAINRVTEALVLLSALGIVGLMLLTVAHVTMRQLGGRGIAGGIEIVEVVLASVVFLGLAQAQRIDAHVSTSLVTDRLPPRVSASMQVFATGVAVLFFAWLVFETGKRGISSWQRGETRVGLRSIPIWPARLIIPIGFAALGLQLVLDLADRISELRAGQLHAATETESA